MQNDFEKQVQKKMEELDFIPSEPVWTNIEREIRKKDKRRYFIWLPVLLLLACGGLYWNYSIKKSVHNSSEQKQLSKINSSLNQTNSGIEGKENNLNKKEKQSGSNNSLTINSDNTIIHNSVEKTSLNTKSFKSNGNAQKNSFVVKKSSLVNKSNIEYPSINDIDPSDKLNSLQVESSIKDRFTIDHILNEPQFNLIFDAVERRTVKSERETKVVVNQRHPWIIGLSFSIGIANQTSGTSSMDKSYAYSGGPSSYPSPSDPKIQSPYTNGLSYSVGLTLRRKLNKAIEFQSGISYQYLSFNVLVGQHVRNDTTINMFALDQFYRNTALASNLPTTLSNYKNQLHLISIPIKFGFQPFAKIPVTLSAGILLQQLIHSNMLVYDPNSGVYYNSSKSLNKFLISTTAGIDYSFPLLKHRISVGPYINYGLSNTIKNMPGHLSNVNFRASMDIKKINKKQRF